MARRVSAYLRNNVLGLVAIFIALGAGAYAAGLGKDSVGSKQIKDGAVKTDELADDAVTSPKVADGSLLGKDFAAGQLPQGAKGPTGPAGVIGQTGPTGAAGVAATSLFASVTNAGDHLTGTATGASRANDGLYNVTFGVNVSACSAVVSPGKNESQGGDVNFATTGGAFPGFSADSTYSFSPSPHTVAVEFLNVNSPHGAADSAFHLAVFC